ncbi:hypothetical protein D6779_12230 [Candidatus Parcubacteria bacterium]|nr:MAG: hypothetical protein D6779_12230 [Candidatus Parcubacteria bacterium]
MMKIAFESELLLPPVSETISLLTNGAKVCIDDIYYNKEDGIVKIQMQRRGLTGFKKTFLGEMKPVYSQTMIKSSLTIRQVEEMNIDVDDRLITHCNSCFDVLFGVKVDGNRLYLESVQEAQGIILCQIYVKVRKLNIEYSDE